jgi:CBS domain-containing protein
MDLLDQLKGPLHVVAGLRDVRDLDALDGYSDEVLAVVVRLLDGSVDVLAVTQAIAHVNDELTTRLLELGEAELGPAPREYAWLSLGSHGRGEQVLSSDQDSALAYADTADDGTTGGATAGGSGDAAGYFVALAGLVVDGLARAGLPLCAGGYMATGWCRPVGEFRQMFHGWVERPEPLALLRAEVFLDVRPVHGPLAVDVLDRTLVAGGSRGPFRVQMARAAVTFRPPIGRFGRLRAPDGVLDVKRAGLAAIVLLARLYALVSGSSARTTLDRLQAAVDADTLHASDAADLADSYRFLTALRLRHQVEQVRAGVAADNLLRLEDLAADERDRLGAALRHLRDVQEATASRFATHMVS